MGVCTDGHVFTSTTATREYTSKEIETDQTSNRDRSKVYNRKRSIDCYVTCLCGEHYGFTSGDFRLIGIGTVTKRERQSSWWERESCTLCRLRI